MDKNIEKNRNKQATDAVDILKSAILQSQTRAVKAVNQEQLALYYGIAPLHLCQHSQQELGRRYDKIH